jgi:hypothetical protein
MKYSHQVPVQEAQGFQELRVFQVIQETQHPLGDLGLQENPGHPEIKTTITLQIKWYFPT